MQKSQSLGQTFYTNESAAASGSCAINNDVNIIDRTSIHNEYYGGSVETSQAYLKSMAAPTPEILDENSI